MLVNAYSESQLLFQIKKYDTVIIYGAGMVGELVLTRLKVHGQHDRILGFCVTKMAQKAEICTFCGLPVYEIADLKKYKENAIILVATLTNLHEEIKNILLEHQFEHLVFITGSAYEDLSGHYMETYNRDHPALFPLNTKTKIVFMASDNNVVSGAFLCMAELCVQLQNRGIGVMIILPYYGLGSSLLLQKKIPHTYILSKDWGYEIAKDHNYWEKVKFWIQLLSNRKAKKEIKQLLKVNQVDLVHCNTTFTYIGAIAAKECGIPYIWHLRENMENLGYRIFAYSKSLKLLQQAAKVIAVSDYIKGLMPFEKEGQICTVYDAVEREKNECSSREILKENIVRMIMVGVLAEHKEQKELIRACTILKKRTDITFHLLLVGKGENEYINELKALIHQGDLQDNISFYGASSNVYELYEQADISFTCGRKEAYGRVTIESLLSGCFVIGVDAGGTSELIQDGKNGYLYKAGDPESLADQIMRTVTNPELSRKMARFGQEHARKTYTKEKNIQQMINIYEEVLDRKL